MQQSQKTLANIYENHQFAAQAKDAHFRSKNSLLLYSSCAYDLQNKVGESNVMKTINYAIKHNLVDRAQVMHALKQPDAILESQYKSLSYKGDDHRKEQHELQKSFNKAQEIERQNQQQKDKDNDRGMGGMSL